MKKEGLLFSLCVCILLIVCSGCELPFGNTNNKSKNENKTTTNKYLKTDNENVFFVQVNNTNDKILSNNIGSITKNQNSRNVLENNQSDDFDNTLNYDYEEIDKYHAMVQELNNVIYTGIRESNNRAAQIIEEITDNTKIVGESYDFFYLHQNSEGKNVNEKGTGKCAAVGTYCNIIYIPSTEFVTEESIDFNKVAKKFDSIYEMETELIGTNRYPSKYYSNYINPVEKIDIIIADIYAPAVKGKYSGVYGYFYSNDLYINHPTYGSKTSNTTQCIYLDSYFLQERPNSMYSTLVHEFNHLLNYCQKIIYKNLPYYKSWYTEMLSMTMEDLFQHYLGLTDNEAAKGRLRTFNNGYFSGFEYQENWNTNGKYVYNSYANAFTFGSYLVRNYGGVELLHEIATNDYTGKDSITAALHKMGYDLTYDDVLKYFPMVTLNVEPDKLSSDYDEIITLNRAIPYSKDLYFDALNLNKYTNSSNYKGPLLFDSGKTKDLFPTGFLVNKLDSKDDFDFDDYDIKTVSDPKTGAFYTYFVNYNKEYN